MMREKPVPWRQWGEELVDDRAIQQMRNACTLPVAVRGALMPDAHPGYGLPIGGVLALEDAVIPYAVGVDIACRMRLSILDMPVSALVSRREALIRAIEQETRFGIGAKFESAQRRTHQVMDEDWSINDITHANKNNAWKQLGTSGGGNHFVEFGELHIASPAEIGGQPLEKGVCLAFLSHSGSRKTGEMVAGHYSKLAMSLRPDLPQEVKHLAWLELSSEAGAEYWGAMELMGRYAAANHELIHAHVLQNLGAAVIAHVENHHNFAWREEYDGKELIVHRKGATPAQAGVEGIIPGSMASAGFVVRGKGHSDSLNSCSHGAGRAMSRAAALATINQDEAATCLREHDINLLSGSLDEAPMAYKDIHAVMAAQTDLVEILARFEPRLVKMAPGAPRHVPRKKRKRG
ncbi:RtcB family protein [Desulfovibrio sp. OttesenSCG-928-F20]|nr:RtcB family protein [Desulfovibrio sp. OttesenSCG-928-F20]